MPEFTLNVMTWNLYMGGDVSKIIGAHPRDVPRRMRALWEMVQRTDFRSRAKAIAAQIKRAAPDVIALQEAFRWSTVERREGAVPEEKLAQDFVEILTNELMRLDCAYYTAARAFGVNLLLPTASGPDVRLEDSVAILLRSGLPWEGARQGRFPVNLKVTIDDEPFRILRGWAAVDLRTDHRAVRLITSHLEYFDPKVQPAQVDEILAGPAAVKGPVILLGDFNCRAGEETWRRLEREGYRDAWSAADSTPGYTSGHDEDLRNAESALSERIDWILCRGNVEAVEAKRLGHEPSDRTPDGLWPSDHAGVSATLRIRFDGGPNERPPRPAPEEQPKEPLAVMQTLFERFSKFDLQGAMDLIDPEGHFHFPGNPAILPWAGDFRGAGMMRFFVACGTALEYIFYRAHTFYVAGDMVTALSRERCRVKATGKFFEHELAAVARVVNGKIVCFLEYADTSAMERAFED